MTCDVTYTLDLTGLHRPAYIARITAAAAAMWAPSGWRFTLGDGATVVVRFADDGIHPNAGAYSRTWSPGVGEIVVQTALANTMPRRWLRYVLTHEFGHVVGLHHGGDGVMADGTTPSPSDIERATCT